jgi:hypothetical protein
MRESRVHHRRLSFERAKVAVAPTVPADAVRAAIARIARAAALGRDRGYFNMEGHAWIWPRASIHP